MLSQLSCMAATVCRQHPPWGRLPMREPSNSQVLEQLQHHMGTKATRDIAKLPCPQSCLNQARSAHRLLMLTFATTDLVSVGCCKVTSRHQQEHQAKHNSTSSQAQLSRPYLGIPEGSSRQPQAACMACTSSTDVARDMSQAGAIAAVCCPLQNHLT